MEQIHVLMANEEGGEWSGMEWYTARPVKAYRNHADAICDAKELNEGLKEYKQRGMNKERRKELRKMFLETDSCFVQKDRPVSYFLSTIELE